MSKRVTFVAAVSNNLLASNASLCVHRKGIISSTCRDWIPTSYRDTSWSEKSLVFPRWASVPPTEINTSVYFICVSLKRVVNANALMLHCWTEQTSWFTVVKSELLVRLLLWTLLELIHLVAVTSIVFFFLVLSKWKLGCFKVKMNFSVLKFQSKLSSLLFLPFRPERSPLPECPFCAEPGSGQWGGPGSSTVPQPAAEPSSWWRPPGGSLSSDPGWSPYSRCGGSTSFCRHW